MNDSRSEQLSRSWEANAEAWTDAVRTGSIESRRVATDGAILEAVTEARPRTVLDVGCGEGWLARALGARGIAVVGVDASGPLIEAARRRGGARFERCTYEEIAAGTVEVGGPFDAVVCNFALLHEDLQPLLTALRARLTDGGSLLVQTVHPWTASAGEYVDGWRTEDFSAMGEGLREPMPWYFRTLESWVRLVGAAGYTLREVREPRHPGTSRPLSLLLVAGIAR